MPCHTYDNFAFVYMLYLFLFLLNIPYELVLTGMHTDNYHTERVLVGTGPIPQKFQRNVFFPSKC